jgi:hypothetical protein
MHMNEKHYTVEELQEFFGAVPSHYGEGGERQVANHLHLCEACAQLAKQVHEEIWAETRKEFKGFQ